MISQKNNNKEEEIEVLFNDCCGGCEISSKSKKLYRERKIKDLNYLHKQNDPIIIQIYNELGNEFDGKYSKLNIERIFKKYENDGLEMVEIDYIKYELDNLKKNIKKILENNSINNDEKINQFTKIII